jgi:hypothetical protein
MISSHTGFQPLQEVWLGNCYPDHFYEHLDPELRDFCCMISEITRQDLQRIQTTIEQFGVQVCRPDFSAGVDAYLDDQQHLIKPPITPRDWALALGNTLYITPQYSSGVQPFQSHLDRYGAGVRILDRFTQHPEHWCYIVFPSVVRVGLDIFIDYEPSDPYQTAAVATVQQELGSQYRLHFSTTGDHSDGVFCPVSPGVIVSTHYREHYGQDFPGWKVIPLPDSSLGYNGSNARWWVPGVDLCHFNNSMLDIIDPWLGDSRETVFEVNMLVIDPANVLVLAHDDHVCRELEQAGITPHVVDFRARGFWDGGLHCLTLDIRRQGSIVNYWPEV